MHELTDVAYIKSILGEADFHFSKALGQNFLINPTVCPRMAELCGVDKESGVIEIGPGFGVLTKELCLRAEKVVAIELDKRLLPVLHKTLADYDNWTVVNADVMQVDLHELIAREFVGKRVYICANLPYYITSQVLMKLLEEHLPVEAITVMVQKEAAQRICAQPGNRECGALSAAVWYYSTPQVQFAVSRGSFLPAPNVDSAVITLQVNKTPAVQVEDPADYFRTVKALFSQRRKTAQNSLSSGLSIPKADAGTILEQAGVSVQMRAEQMTLRDLGNVANAVAAYGRTMQSNGKE